MQITEERKDNSVTLKIEGRIDVNGSEALEAEIKPLLASPAVWTLVLDFSSVDYISSAGIRVLLLAQKRMKENHEMIIRKPSAFCKQVFDVTGADIFLKIEY